MTKREAITTKFLNEYAADLRSNPDGMQAALRNTWGKVFGNVISYDDFVDDLYHSLRAQAGIAS